MKKDAARLAGIATVLILASALAAGFYLRHQRLERAEQVAARARSGDLALVRPHSRSLGPPDAKVTVVEFLDPECESCREIHPWMKHLLGRYPGRVRFVLRYMPLHPNAAYAASALEAAGEQGRYWDMLEILFRYQPQWGSHHAPRPDLIPEYARAIGLDMVAFEQSLRSGAHRRLVEIDLADGRSLGVTGTPTFFVNGRPLERLSFEHLRALIEEELAK